jgi:hypothetical protein
MTTHTTTTQHLRTLRDSLQRAIADVESAKRASTDSAGHTVYLAMQHFHALASPATIYRLLYLITQLESELTDALSELSESGATT